MQGNGLSPWTSLTERWPDAGTHGNNPLPVTAEASLQNMPPMSPTPPMGRWQMMVCDWSERNLTEVNRWSMLNSWGERRSCFLTTEGQWNSQCIFSLLKRCFLSHFCQAQIIDIDSAKRMGGKSTLTRYSDSFFLEVPQNLQGKSFRIQNGILRISDDQRSW